MPATSADAPVAVLHPIEVLRHAVDAIAEIDPAELSDHALADEQRHVGWSRSSASGR